MKIRVEVSSLASIGLSGVASYTKMLTESLYNHEGVIGHAAYFNFLNRQPTPKLSLNNRLEKNALIPLRVYAKLQSHSCAFPFDIILPKVDLTIFPNFATWPTIRSKLSATVIHDLTYLYFPELVESKNLAHLRRVVPNSIKKADFIITVSEAVKTELVKEFSIDPEACIVTPIPPDQSFFKVNNNEVHKKYSIPTKKYIYFVGNLEPRKDLPTLIKAYRQLPLEIKNEYSLVMAGGTGWKTESSREAIKSAQDAGEKVLHIGYIDQSDASALYQKASLFVMPSVYEGFGIPILESMACHTPVIASDIPVLRETGGDAALYAKVGDPSDFCHKIITVLSSIKLINRLNEKAVIQLEKISWQRNADNLVNYAQKLLDRK
jgi:glycosyltransferase involved in cell wall biosynthesis